MTGYKIRERVRREASPKEGLRQEWVEYQVVSGRTIMARCGSRGEAEAEVGQLTRLDR